MASRCKKCNLPKHISNWFYWTTRGEMFPKQPGGERLLFLDVLWIRFLAQEIRKEGGGELSRRIEEIRREHTRRRMERAIGSWGKFLLHRRFTGRKILEDILNELPRYGYGKFVIKEFGPRKLIQVRATHAYDDFFLPADLWGLWEGSQGVKASAQLERTGDGSFTLILRTVEKVKGEDDRPRANQEKLPSQVKEDDIIQLCPKCRCPIYPGRMSWSEDRGILSDDSSGRRFIITPVASWVPVFSLLKKETPKVYESFAERLAARHSSQVDYPGNKDLKAVYRDYFLSLPFLGWGKPVRVARKPFLVDAELLGIPFPEILAADMRGLFGTLENEDWSVDVRATGNGRHRFIMGPSLEGPWFHLDTSNFPRAHPGLIFPC